MKCATNVEKQTSDCKIPSLNWQPSTKVLVFKLNVGVQRYSARHKINKICKEYELWNHVDAAYAGNAFILEEYQHFINDLSHADSYVFNPHKWLFVNFDCSVFFIKSKEALLRTFEILPEYLKILEFLFVLNCLQINKGQWHMHLQWLLYICVNYKKGCQQVIV